MQKLNSDKDRSETTSPASEHRVAVFSRCGDVDRFTETLVATLGLNRIDARIHAAHVPGVLPEQLTQKQAEKAAVAVTKLGVSAAAVPATDIPDFDHPIVLHHAACNANGLEILGLTGARTSLISWPDVEFVSVGCVPLEPAHHSSTEPLVVVHSSPHTFDDESEHVGLSGPACWLIAKTPQRIYFLNHNQMNYEYLGARKSGSATANFGEFLVDVANFATDSLASIARAISSTPRDRVRAPAEAPVRSECPIWVDGTRSAPAGRKLTSVQIRRQSRDPAFPERSRPSRLYQEKLVSTRRRVRDGSPQQSRSDSATRDRSH